MKNLKSILRPPFCALLLLLTLGVSNASELNEPAPNYHYSGTIEFDPTLGKIDVAWQISVNDASAQNLDFVLRSSLGNISAIGEPIEGFTVEDSDLGDAFQALKIRLQPANGNQIRVVELRYSGVLLPEPLDNRINQISANAIELNVDSFWLPMDARFNQLLTVDLNIVIDSEWQAVGAGKLAPTDNGYRLTNTTPSIDIAFALAKDVTVTRQSGFTLYDFRNNQSGIDKLSAAAEFCVSELNQRYGESRPLMNIDFTINERPSSGYARGSYIALTDVAETSPEHLTQFVCHEMAHHWSRGGKFDTEENWLNEAFAEYVGMMMLRQRFGAKAFEERLAGFEEQLNGKTLGPVWTPELTSRPDYLVAYRKAPLLLHSLEQKLGQVLFNRLVTIYMIKSLASTEQLLQELRLLTGSNTVEWFTERLAQ